MHLVVHPRKTMTDRDEPGKVDVKGSSHITDLVHNVIVLYRLDEDFKEKQKKKGITTSDMQLYVKKNREYGIEGRVYFNFNEITRRFTTEESGM
jgi:replicative DNA helicase